MSELNFTEWARLLQMFFFFWSLGPYKYIYLYWLIYCAQQNDVRLSYRKKLQYWELVTASRQFIGIA
jgi:hypothetical protein